MAYVQTVNPWIQASGVANEGTAALSNLALALAQMRYGRQRDAQSLALGQQQFGLQQQEFAQRQQESQQRGALAQQQFGLDQQRVLAEQAAQERLKQQFAMEQQEYAKRLDLAKVLGEQALQTPYGDRPGAGVYKAGMAPNPAPTPDMQKQSALVQLLALSNPAALERMAQPAAQAVSPWQDIMDSSGRLIRKGSMAPPQVAGNAERLLGSQGGMMLNDDQKNQLMDVVLSAGRGVAPQVPGGMPPQQAGPPRFPDEQSARSAGAKPGDTVYLQGVGLVRLR